MGFTDEAIRIEPRLSQADFDLTHVFDTQNDMAYISGSVVEGFGNSASDVDIYIVTKNPILPDGVKFGYNNNEKGYYNEVNIFVAVGAEELLTNNLTI
jgi:hypothetical protein